MMVSLLAVVSSLAQLTPAPPPETPPPESTIEQGEDASLGVSTFVDLEGSVGYSSNPDLETDSSGQGFGRVAINATHARQGDRSTTVLSLYGENTTYSGRSGSQQLLRATASHQVAVTETLRMFGDLTASLDRGGQLGTRFIGAPNAPVPVPPSTIPSFPQSSDDLVLVGERTYRLSGQAGAQITLSQRDSMTIRSGAERVIFRGNQSDNDFTSLFGSAGYDRQLNERASAGHPIGHRHSDYSRDRTAREINPQVNGPPPDRRASSTLVGAAGVSFAENDDGEDTQHSVGLTFDASICGRSERQTFCAASGSAITKATALPAHRKPRPWT